MAYNSMAVANFYVDLAREKQQSLTPMKLQKLIYFAHGWHLAINNAPLIDENIEAWQYGPVIPSIYHEFKSCGSSSINRYATDFDLENFELTTPFIPEDDTQTAALLNKIWEVYGKYSGTALSNLTHEPDTPWAKIWGENIPKGTDIPNESIKEYFLNLANKNK